MVISKDEFQGKVAWVTGSARGMGPVRKVALSREEETPSHKGIVRERTWGYHNPRMSGNQQYAGMLHVALEEARAGLHEGGIPIGAALMHRDGRVLGRGHNRRVQQGDPSMHAETDAFRRAGRQRAYRDTIMVTTLAPCWYCCGLIVQFQIGTVVVGEARNFTGGVAWLRERGIEVIDLDSRECTAMLKAFIDANPALWHEDIGIAD